ncbi:right-handed parallel beta-helix repeat-containing protein, partial [Frankia sp. Cas3]|uniref:right-handed parallel beta-helix repeat-containing protein n=1 Tax=Frankia sp. Cas3 TaxID=3073926 RepID=UPI002AD4B014
RSGVYVYDDGAGVFEDNEITGNTRDNVAVGSGGNPTVRGNRITNSQSGGVYIHDNGAGVFEGNIVNGNRRCDWDVSGADQTRMVRR